MNKEEFINILKKVVVDPVIRGTKDVIGKPPGRSPRKEYLTMSKFYNSLNETDKSIIDLIIKASVEGAIFQVLSVFDGVVAFETEKKGKIELKYVSNGAEVLLNDPEQIDLHDLFNM